MSARQRIGKYEVAALIARGNASKVCRGIDPATRREFALKIVPRAALDAAAMARLQQAAPALARLRHPALATFIEILESGSAVCVVSEIAQGVPLAALPKEGAPDLRRAWGIARQVLDALAAAHARNIVHGDLRPANIFIDEQARVSVTDIGQAGLVGHPQPQYAAPEQLGVGEVTPRTDVYQLGVIVYELVTGELPFTGSRDEIVHRHLEERPEDPSSLTGVEGWQLDWVIQRALAKDPADRFATAADFAEALRKGFEHALGTTLAPIVQAARAVPANAMAVAPQAARDPRPRVLFVDDEERIVGGLRALFRHEYNVFTSDNGAEALELVKKHAIQVVVSDQRMPGMTGVALLRQVKEQAPHAVRILLTGYTDLAALVGSINEGEIFRFVRKPWDNDELRRTLAEAVAMAVSLEGAQAAPAEAPRTAGSLLVIDPNGALARGLQTQLAGRTTVRVASGALEAAKLLEEEGTAAIVADIDAGRDHLVSLFKLLKTQRPEILSILVADEPDAELAADLVNNARIFRFLAKPVDPRELRGHVTAALRRHATFRKIPSLVHRLHAAKAEALSA
ncbi:MAG TPA: response regulator [Usitatibacter sp.]|nr:response regulator [Usitatibacter sp.]